MSDDATRRESAKTSGKGEVSRVAESAESPLDPTTPAGGPGEAGTSTAHNASAACELCGGKEVATCFLCSESKGATHK
jgi:hypothetical protein